MRAEAGPRVAKAMESAGPKVEKAAMRAGKLLGTLRERAKDTAKEFSAGYQSDADEPATEAKPDESDRGPGPRRPRPRKD
jgi:vacuolar-type H+-ATPase subunit H